MYLIIYLQKEDLHPQVYLMAIIDYSSSEVMI